MATRTLEEAFARFRAERDLEALAEVFDRTAPELLALARHLSRERSAAEDLVQASFLAAIEGAERFEEGRALVPWLLGILVHLARRERGRRGALGEPAAELVDARTPDPTARAAEDEFRAALEGALERMPPTYREVLASHLGEGQAPDEIARRLGLAPGTVRVRLHRGLRHLRGLLPASFALGALGWLSSRGLSAVRREVLRAARGGRAPLASGLLGGLLMAKKLALVTLLLLGVASAWWLTRQDEHGTAPVLEAAVAEGPLSAPSSGEPSSVEREASRVPAVEARTGSDEASAEPYGALSVILHWWDGSPAAAVPVCFTPAGERQPEQAFQQRATDAEGRARVARIHEGPVFLKVERLGREGVFRIEVARGAERVERLTLERNRDVVGRVVDRNGLGVAGAWLWAKEDSLHPGHAVECAGTDGSFRVRSLPEGFGLFATASGGGSSLTVTWESLEASEAEHAPAELILRGMSADLDGSITDPSGQPVAGARIAVRCIQSVGKDTGPYPFVLLASDAKGWFHAGGLSAGPAEVLVAAAGCALKKTYATLEEGRTARLDVALDTGFTVRGRVLDRDGTPVAGAGIRAQQEGFYAEELYGLVTYTDEAGAYRLELLPAGAIVLRARERESGALALRAQTRLMGRNGDVLTWDVSLGSGPSIRGRAMDESGRPLAGWSVQALPGRSGDAAPSSLVTTGERGTFAIPGLADALYTVVLYAPEDRSTPRASAEGVRPEEAEIELVVRGERAPSSYLVGRVLDPDGHSIHAELWARREDSEESVGNPTWSEDERFRIGPMLSGAYVLSISVEERTVLESELVLEEGEEHDLGDILLPRPGEARLTLQGPDGETIPPPFTAMLMGERAANLLTSEDGIVFASGPMNPGSYGLLIMGGRAAPASPVTIEIRPGEVTTAALRLAAARGVVFEFRVPGDARLPRQLSLEVRNAADELAYSRPSCKPQSVSGTEFLMAASTLALGRFRYSARTEEGWAAAGEFEVVPGSEPQQRVIVSLAR